MWPLRRGGNWKLVSFDVSQAFTFDKIPEGSEGVYMELPQMLGEGGARVVNDQRVPDNPGLYPDCGHGRESEYVAKLNNFLYGQKDASRAWMREIQLFMDWIGPVPLVSDRMRFRWLWEGEEIHNRGQREL